MAKFQIFCMIFIAALLSAGMLAPAVDAECYEIHPEIRCENGNPNACSGFCKKEFGPKTTVQCILMVGIPGPFCVCNDCPPKPPRAAFLNQ